MSKVIKTFKFSKVLSIIFLVISIYTLFVLAYLIIGLFLIMMKNDSFAFPLTLILSLVQILIFIYQVFLVKNYNNFKSLKKIKRRVAIGDLLSFVSVVTLIPIIALTFMEVQNKGIKYELIDEHSHTMSYFIYPVIIFALATLIIIPITLLIKNRTYKKNGYDNSEQEISLYVQSLKDNQQAIKSKKEQKMLEIRNQKLEIKEKILKEKEIAELKKQEYRVLLNQENERKKEEKTAKKQEILSHKKSIKNEKRQKSYNKNTSFNIVIYLIQFVLSVLYIIFMNTIQFEPILYIVFVIFTVLFLITDILVNYIIKYIRLKIKINVGLSSAWIVIITFSLLVLFSALTYSSASSNGYDYNPGKNNINVVLYVLFIFHIILAIYNLAKSIYCLVKKINNPLFIDHDEKMKELTKKKIEENKILKAKYYKEKKDINTLIKLQKMRDNAYNINDYSRAEEITKQIIEHQNQTGLANVSYFDGRLLQLIGYKILGALITIFSLGILYPWAICFVKRWETIHTVVDGKRLSFNGNGAQLFGKYIIWFVLSIITLGIYSFWLKLSMVKWVTIHTYDCSENEIKQYQELNEEIKTAGINNDISKMNQLKEKLVDFSQEHKILGVSKFDGNILQYIGTNILSFIIKVFTLGILIPYSICLKQNYLVKHTIILGKRQYFDGKAWQLFGQYIKWFLLIILTLGIYSFWVRISLKRWVVKHTHYL